MRAWLAIALALVFVTSTAQTHEEPVITVGGKMGASFARTQFNPTVPQKLLTGGVAGVTFSYCEEPYFAIIAELNVEQRGWREDFEGAPYSFQRRLTYLQLPLMTHIFFGSEQVKGFFNVGPEIGYMIATSTSANFNPVDIGTLPDFPTTNRNTDQYTLPIKNHLDYGIGAGLGMELYNRRARGSFVLEGRFYYGLQDIFANHKKDTFAGSSGIAVMVTLGYNYRIK